MFDRICLHYNFRVYFWPNVGRTILNFNTLYFQIHYIGIKVLYLVSFCAKRALLGTSTVLQNIQLRCAFDVG